MSHENSETVRIGKRWFNRATVGTAKRRLGSPAQRKAGFATAREAVAAAKKRSASSKLPRLGKLAFRPTPAKPGQ